MVGFWPNFSQSILLFPGDGILFVVGAQLCRDLLPEPHFKRFSWMELAVMLVSSFCLLDIKVLDSHKCIPKIKGVGKPAGIGCGPHWAGLGLGVQVYVVRLSLHFTKLKQFNPEA